MMSRAMSIFNYALGTIIVSAFFWGYSDRTWSALVHWAMFYFAALALPFYWARRTHRLLDELRTSVPKELRSAAYYPILIGLLTMLIGISLIREATLR